MPVGLENVTVQCNFRESQIIGLIAKGFYEAEDIAKELQTSSASIKNGLSKIYRKLHLDGGTKAKKIRLAILIHRLMEPPPPMSDWEKERFEYLLSPRERRIALMVANGATNEEIAKVFYSTRQAIRQDLQRLFNKLGFWNRVELAVWASFKIDASPLIQ